jgi:hypothetical protein
MKHFTRDFPVKIAEVGDRLVYECCSEGFKTADLKEARKVAFFSRAVSRMKSSTFCAPAQSSARWGRRLNGRSKALSPSQSSPRAKAHNGCVGGPHRRKHRYPPFAGAVQSGRPYGKETGRAGRRVERSAALRCRCRPDDPARSGGGAGHNRGPELQCDGTENATKGLRYWADPTKLTATNGTSATAIKDDFKDLIKPA